jgi:hypothetical protein
MYTRRFMHCRLLIPDLVPSQRGFTEALSQRLPALETLLARGRRHSVPWHGLEPWLMECFAVERQHDWPSAPFALLGEGIAPGDAFWAHAEPVHLRPDGDRVRAAGGSMLNLSDEEAKVLAATINAHFGDALSVELAGGRWYARLASPPSQATVPFRQLDTVETRSASIEWHKVMNEVQMLLYEHPVNQAREAGGHAPVNGVWLWGGGRFSAANDPGLRAVFSSNPLARGLASAAGVRQARLPERFERWLEATDDDGVHLIVIDELSESVLSGDVQRWSSVLAGLEQRVFAPLLEGLRRGRLGMLTVHATGGDRLVQSEAIRADLRRFWRRSRPLAWHAASH